MGGYRVSRAVIVRIFHYLALIAVGFLLSACDAPRDNPLDPDADNYMGPMGIVSGRVTNLASVPLSDVMVLAIPGYRGGVTDNSGYFLIENVEAGDYQVSCGPSGFEPDTQFVTVRDGLTSVVNFQLDALPVISNFQVTSHYLYLGTQIPPQTYIIYARSHISDPDGFGDIEQVTLEFEGGLDTLMAYSPDSSSGSSLFYFVQLPLDFFPGASIDSVKWKKFTCTAEDTSGNVASSEPLSIQRFFDDYPVQIYPFSDIVSSSGLYLWWEPYDEQFFFTYTVRIFKEGYSTPVWERSGISPTDSTTTVGVTLENGDYNWTLEVIDEYGNTARTAPATFTVQ
ncbi:MAG TPA: carboxypeptidase regulatory-like domain-containing protein [Bacteroidetes bacterium]|nr:carboxypeptidase regulatory-like domain-containing protein [Bacteroidota bacterium]